MKLSKVPKHIWWGIVLPAVLLGLGFWQFWPSLEEYWEKEDRKAVDGLFRLYEDSEFSWGMNCTFIDEEETYYYWTGDVSKVLKFRGIESPEDYGLALADVAPMDPLEPQPVPFHGYYFVALERDNSTQPPEDYRLMADESGLKVYHPSRFAFCAYPANSNWRHGLTYIINQEGVVYSIDNDGKPVTEWPTNEELTGKFEPIYSEYYHYLKMRNLF